jgi:hypothetical protein
MKGQIPLASIACLLSSLALADDSQQPKFNAGVPKDPHAFVQRVQMAAPQSIVQNATIRMPDGMEVQKGTNGFTCSTTGDGTPWCADAGGVAWFKAIGTKVEEPQQTGFIYMLAGDLGTNNADPFSTAHEHWVVTGPHVMVVGKAAREMAQLYPHDADANAMQPFVMFPGTKYEHLMLPVTNGSGGMAMGGMNMNDATGSTTKPAGN